MYASFAHRIQLSLTVLAASLLLAAAPANAAEPGVTADSITLQEGAPQNPLKQ